MKGMLSMLLVGLAAVALAQAAPAPGNEVPAVRFVIRPLKLKAPVSVIGFRYYYYSINVVVRNDSEIPVSEVELFTVESSPPKCMAEGEPAGPILGGSGQTTAITILPHQTAIIDSHGSPLSPADLVVGATMAPASLRVVEVGVGKVAFANGNIWALDPFDRTKIKRFRNSRMTAQAQVRFFPPWTK